MYVLNVCFNVCCNVCFNVCLKYVGPTANAQQGTSERGRDLMWY